MKVPATQNLSEASSKIVPLSIVASVCVSMLFGTRHKFVLVMSVTLLYTFFAWRVLWQLELSRYSACVVLAFLPERDCILGRLFIPANLTTMAR